MIKKDPIVKKKIGKKYLFMRKSHLLPMYLKTLSFYDSALPRICKELNKIDGFLKLIDVGANIGDTVSLITDEVSGTFLCIEGDYDFIPLLKKNLRAFKGNKIYIEKSYCSEDNKAKNLEAQRINGTSKLRVSDNKVNQKISFKTLDLIVKENPKFYDSNILKIDTDGFEINVIKGAGSFLKKAKPAIFFEFTPQDYVENKQDPMELFDMLESYGYENALFYDNFGKPYEFVNLRDREKIESLIELIDSKSIYYYDILVFHSSKEESYKTILLNELISCFKISDKDSRILQEKYEISTKENIELTSTNQSLSSELNNIRSSYIYKTLVISRKILNKIAPQKSIRYIIMKRIFYRLMLIIRSIIHISRNLKRNIFFLYFSILKYIKPRKKRRINYNSKKIAYIGHSFHSISKSTVFLLDLLRKHYDVEVILDESWNGKAYPDISHIDNSYFGVVFFQSLPSIETYNKIDNENITFFPMLESILHSGAKRYKGYKGLKVCHFSKMTYKAFVSLGFDSMYIQYFPPVKRFYKGNKRKVFFWQRITNININTISKLFGRYKVGIHLHKAIDPFQKYIKPSKEVSTKFSITYSKWFKTREEMHQLIKSCAIYIAPREFEGIGLSYLEAMAMGKAVVTVNNPTMNEYIINNKTGYIYNPRNIKEIDFSNLRQIQTKTYNYMEKGYKNWERNKGKIIEYLRKR